MAEEVSFRVLGWKTSMFGLFKEQKKKVLEDIQSKTYLDGKN